MMALDERRRRFVEAYFELHEGTAAAQAAGYADNGKTGIRVRAHRLLHDEKVLAAMREEARGRYVGLLPKAMQAQQEILLDRGHKDRFKASQHIAAAAGIATVVEHRHEHVLSVSEQFAELIRLGKKPEEVLMNLPEAEKRQVLELVKQKDGSFG